MSDDASLLEEVRQLRQAQQSLLDEYRRVANASLALQQDAIAMQRTAVEQQRVAVSLSLRVSSVLRIALLVGGGVVAWLLWRLLRLGF